MPYFISVVAIALIDTLHIQIYGAEVHKPAQQHLP